LPSGAAPDFLPRPVRVPAQRFRGLAPDATPVCQAMRSVTKYDVVIAGAGPAGLATALYLLRSRPDFAGRIVALEKSRHPRVKVCAGGLIPKTMLALRELGLELEVPAVEVVRGVARTEVGDVDMYRGDPLCTVVRRDEFDASLARAARQAGLEIIENCRLLDVAQSQGEVRLTTDRGIFETGLVVGCDGSGSRVRASIFGQAKESVGRAVMTDLPVDPERTPEFLERRYRFDFRCVGAGVSGYAWSFPCLIGGRPHLNLGIYDQLPPHRGGDGARTGVLLEELRRAFPELALEALGKSAATFKAFPIRWFNAAERFTRGHVMLAGDAAGVDPLMGEGISCAFEHGRIAALAIADFLQGDADALARYDRELHQGALGRKLRMLAFAARRFYGPRHRWFFRLARISRKAQQVGVDWFNGAEHFDELPITALVAKWVGAVLFDRPVR
jgi:flavin-dependent dehydrogenase